MRPIATTVWKKKPGYPHENAEFLRSARMGLSKGGDFYAIDCSFRDNGRVQRVHGSG
jgi:hypothetical protein